jgi:two-component system, chemotaxis family, protein-glutamate methylesterase/glutaminase
LRELEVEGLSRYRCLVGHAFTEGSLLASQSEAVELALWTAIRTFEERATVLSKLAIKYEHARVLREFVLANHADEESQESVSQN